MFKIISIGALLLFFASCTSDRPFYTKFLNRDSLPTQRITVDNTKDTTVRTANGALIKIGKGSFSKETVQLEIREAYTTEQMILAGLTTTSDGQPLSSGGMIFLDAANDAEIVKPLEISIPTEVYDSKMQLYKGEEENGAINWTDPVPLKNDSAGDYFARGKQLFRDYCGSCHALDQVVSGPALSGVEGRGPWNSRQRLLEFTANPAAFIPKTCYTQQLYKQYNSIMPAFGPVKEVPIASPVKDYDTSGSISHHGSESDGLLSVEEMNAIYDYIRNEDMKKGIRYSTNYNPSCDDSCYAYDSLKLVLSGARQQRGKLIDSNEYRIDFEWNFPVIESVDTAGNLVPPPPDPELVIPVGYKAGYYKFEMTSFGWYNVDYLLNGKTGQTELKLAVQGNYQDNMSVFIVVPTRKIFAEGGPLKGEKDLFGFFATDGTIPLPGGTEVIVFAVGEVDGEIVFDYRKFTSTEKQTITLTPAKVTKKEFNKAVRKFRLDDVKIEAGDSKNAREIRKADGEIRKNETLLDKYRPKNCDCNCGRAMDSTGTLSASEYYLQ